MIDKDSLPLDKPRRTPGHPTKSHVVKTRVDGSEKIIRFGEQGASTAGKPKEGESEAMKQKRASFKARHAKNIAKGKSSPAYWADKTKWATGGSVELEDLDEKYEGIKKPDFKLLESFRELIRTLQERAADSGTQEFDPVRALGRSGAAGSLEDLYEAYSDKPASHASRAEAGSKDPKRTETAKMVFDSFKNAGFSDAQAKALTAEINREGSFNPAYLYGSHTDAANKATNVGMLSWQGDRANRLMSFMADRGLIDPAGRITPGQAALNAQAEYLRSEMENDPSYAATRETFLANPNIDQETAHNILGKNFIRWRIDDPKYRGSGFDRISEGYDLLNMAQGYAEGGLAEIAHKYEKGGKKKTQLSGSLDYKSGSHGDNRRKRASGSLTLSGDLGSITPGFSYSKDSSRQQFPDGFVVDEFGRQIGLSINGELFLDDSGDNKLRAGASKDTMTGGYSETSGEELLGEDAYKQALERYFLGLDIGPLSLDVNKAGDDVSGRAAYRAGDNMEFSVEDSNRGDPTFGFQFAKRFAEGGLAQLAHKYDKGGKKKDDELARASMLADLELMAQPKNPKAVPAEDPRLLNVGGLEERLALLNQTFNPVEAIGESMDAGSRMMSPDVSGYDRLAALGDMLSGVAGVAGPMAVAKRVGAPAASAVMEGLLGGSPTAEALADMGRKYAVDESGALRLPSVEEIDPAALQAEEVLGLLRSGREDEITEQMLDMGDPVLNARLNEYLYRNYDLPMDYESRMARAEAMGALDEYHGTTTGSGMRYPRADFGSGTRKGTGFFTSSNPYVASSYADPSYGSVFPMKNTTPPSGLASVDVAGDIWSQIPGDATVSRRGMTLPVSSYASGSADMGGVFDTNQIARGAALEGDGGVRFLNLLDRSIHLPRVKDDPSVMREFQEKSSVPSTVTTRQDTRGMRSRFARFDPRLAHLRNLSAGVAAGAIGASQYDPDAIETTATRVRENKFAAGGAVKYDPAAVDGIINKLREVNRG